jgi:hypothetical protein
MELTRRSALFLKLCDGRTLDRVVEGLEIDAELETLGRQQVGLLTFRKLPLLLRSPRSFTERAHHQSP